MKFISFIICGILVQNCTYPKPQLTGFEGKPLPSFNFLLMDSITRFNTNNIPIGKPTVLIYISPICPYCRAQTQEIIRDMKYFKNVQLYLLTNFPFNLLKDYYQNYNLNKFKNITVGYDFTSYLPNYFKIKSVPYIAIFNKQKLLKQIFVGKVDNQLLKNTTQN